MFENIYFPNTTCGINWGTYDTNAALEKYKHPNNILINHYHLIKHAKNFVAAKHQMDNLLLFLL